MAITGSAFYGLTLEKYLKSTAAVDLESETNVYCIMVTDTYAPAFDTHDFYDDITNEVTGTNYTAGGQALTTTELTVGSPAAGQIKYDSADPSWASSTIADAMAAVHYGEVGASSADELIFLSDFVTAASTTNGTFTIQVDTNGWWYIDYDLT